MHTKGPWTVGTSVDNGIHCVDGLGEDGSVIEICEVWGTRHDKEPDETSSANARLLASAPDLLEALEACLNFIENTESEWATILSCGDMARAAIAKAKGV